MSEKINDGGAAFPRTQWTGSVNNSAHRDVAGMTLRDWFASGAMQAILISLKERGILPNDVPKMASDCYFIADAMLAERAKREGGKS